MRLTKGEHALHDRRPLVALSPNVLAAIAKVVESPLSLRHSAQLLRWASRGQLPIMAANWLASRRPSDSSGVDRSAVDPCVKSLEHRPGPAFEGALTGERIVVKDSLDVAGEVTGAGLAYGVHRATQDATLVARLLQAGAWVCGKAKMTELGMDGLGAVMPYPMPDNPRAPGYFAGGSSTGTAVALARGLARYGVGADGLGSVRIPAGFCGLVGLKPGLGALPTHGSTSVAPTMDMPGPMARDVADCAWLWQVLAGEPVEALTPWLPARVGLIEGLGPELACDSVKAAFWRVIRTLGLPTTQVAIKGAAHCTLLGAGVASTEAATHPLSQRSLTPSSRLNVAMGLALAELGSDEAPALVAQREALTDSVRRAFDQVPLLVMPTSPIPAPAITDTLLTGAQNGLLMRAIGGYTPLANLARVPAIAVPCGVDDRGRPLSVMAVGPQGSETLLLRFALAIEATGLGRVPVEA